MMPTREQTDAALAWMFRHVDHLDLAVRRWVDGRAVWIHPDRPRGKHLRALGIAGVQRMLPWARSENAHGADVFVRPARGDAALVLLDDLTPAQARQIAGEYAALAVQTSQGSAQVRIVLDRGADESERKTIQQVLIAQYGADTKASGGVQLGRLPGLRNRKPVHSAAPPWCTLLAATEGPALVVASVLPAASPPPRGGGARGDGERANPSTRGARAARVESRAGNTGASEQDWAVACRAIERGLPDAPIIDAICRSAIARGKRGGDPAACREYAIRTVARARAHVSGR